MVGSGQFAGYSLYAFDLNTPSACTTKVVMVGTMPLSCAGPETDKSADWPVLTTVGKPVAGPGVNKHLLGEVNRKDIGGEQVTYAGKLLYLFDMAPRPVHRGEFRRDGAPAPALARVLVPGVGEGREAGFGSHRSHDPDDPEWPQRSGGRHVPGSGGDTDRRLHLQQGHEGSQCVHGDLRPDLATGPDDRSTPGDRSGLRAPSARSHGRTAPDSSPSTVSRCTSTQRKSPG